MVGAKTFTALQRGPSEETRERERERERDRDQRRKKRMRGKI